MDTQHPTNGQSTDPSVAPPDAPSLDRNLMVTVPDAASLLGLTSEAVRSRVKRGTLPSRRIAGTVYVLIDETTPLAAQPTAPSIDQPVAPPAGPSHVPPINTSVAPSDAWAELEHHVDTLKDEVLHLRAEMLRREETHAEEIRRRDHLLAAALERIPRELEAPTGTRDTLETASEGTGRGEEAPPEPQEPAQSRERRSWWRRFFGFE